MRLCIHMNLHILIGKTALKCHNQRTAFFHITVQPLKRTVRNRIKRRYKNRLILRKLLRFRPYKITLHIHLIQRIINPANHIIVANFTIIPGSRLNAKPVQCSQSLIAHHHSHIIFLLKIHQTAAFFPKFFSNNTSLTVSIILRKIMAQKSLPVSFKRIMDRMPVPVHHTVGPGCQMTVGTETKLTFIRRPARKSLSFRL